ncbi:hypothetical protein JCM3765_006952 [Sporobolomyces pararoseus]
MTHKAQQPSTASSSMFAYSSFDPDPSSSSSSTSPPRMTMNDYSSSSSYAYDHHSATDGVVQGYDYDLEEFESPRLRGDRDQQERRDSSSALNRTRRNDSIFSFTTTRNQKNIQQEEELGGGEAFQGEEYRNDPFRNSNSISSRGKKPKRYGLSQEESSNLFENAAVRDQDGFSSNSGDEDEEDEEEDLEVYGINTTSTAIESISPKLSGSGGVGGGKRNRFEALTIQELSWMGISAVLTTGLLVGAVVVTVIG